MRKQIHDMCRKTVFLCWALIAGPVFIYMMFALNYKMALITFIPSSIFILSLYPAYKDWKRSVWYPVAFFTLFWVGGLFAIAPVYTAASCLAAFMLLMGVKNTALRYAEYRKRKSYAQA